MFVCLVLGDYQLSKLDGALELGDFVYVDLNLHLSLILAGFSSVPTILEAVNRFHWLWWRGWYSLALIIEYVSCLFNQQTASFFLDSSLFNMP